MPGNDERGGLGDADRLASASPVAGGEDGSTIAQGLSPDGFGDSYTEVTHTSWLERLADAAVGVIIGLFLVVGSAVLLFWNEGRAVQTARSLTEGAGVVTEADPRRVDPALEGQLVHLQGDLVTPTPLRDPTFSVTATGARLVRKVEMYQWREDKRTETRKKLGGGEETVTTYHYVRVWSDRAIPSGGFRQAGHDNPPWSIEGAEFLAHDATLGAFRPGGQALHRLPATEPLPLPPDHLAHLRGRTGQVADGVLYFGDPVLPRVGDLKVSYALAPSGGVSFVGRQTGSALGPYQTRAGDAILLAANGLVPADALFAKAQADNRVLTWILRAVGLLVMLAGWFLVTRPLSVVADLVPLVGDLIGFGLAAVSLALTAVFGPLVIALAWAWSRPLLALGVLGGGLATATALRWLAAERRAAEPPRRAPLSRPGSVPSVEISGQR